MASLPGDQNSAQVDAAVASYLEAIEHGVPPDREAFLAQHGAIANELREFLDDYHAINHVMPGQRADDPTDGNARSTGGTGKHPEPVLALPRWFAGFELLEEIARGGMGVVYKARQKNPDRIVAVKMILAGQLASQADVDRFSAEAHAAAALDHPHIVPIFEVGEQEGHHYFAMGYVPGESLGQRLLRGPLPAREAATIVAEVATAVQYAHGCGIVHRDLKPANILLDSNGRVRVTDFGLAKRQNDERGITRTGQLLGTPSFMSPEQVSGSSSAIGPASDVYSLGATLYTLVTGRPPFQAASTIDTLKQVVDREPVPPREFDPNIPRDLETISLKALAKEPTGRYRTAGEMSDDLNRYLADRPILARRSTAPERLARWCRRNPAVASLATIVVVALIAGTMVSTWQAMRATRAERLAEQRFQMEQSARAAEVDQRRIAEHEKEIAESERAEAEKQRATAEANYEKARAVVDESFTFVSERTLFDKPGLQPVRKELLEAALRYYKDFSDSRATDPAALAKLASMHLRVGAIYIALNRSDDFIASANHALEAIDRLRRDHPEGGDYERKLSGFWSGARWAWGSIALPRDAVGALRTMLRLDSTWRQLADKYPTEAAFQADLSFIDVTLGVGLSENKRLDDGISFFQKARAIIEKLIAEHPDVAQYRVDLVFACASEAFYLTRAGRSAAALPISRRAVELGEGLATEFPSVPIYRFKLADALVGMAGALARTDPIASKGSMRRGIEIYAALARDFPDVPDYLYREADNLHRLAKTLESVGRPSDAQDAYRSATEAANRLVHRFPENKEYLASACELYTSIAGASWGSGRTDEGAEHYQSAVTLLENVVSKSPNQASDVRLLADRTTDLARILADGARTRDTAATCALCVRTTQMLDGPMEDDPTRRSALAIAIFAYAQRLSKESKPPPDVESLLKWSTPIVEQAIKDSTDLDRVPLARNAPTRDRHIAAEAQRWLAKILGGAGRAAEAEKAWLRAIQSYQTIAQDHPDQQIMVQYALEDYRGHLQMLFELFMKDQQFVEAEQMLRNAIDTVSKYRASTQPFFKAFGKAGTTPEPETRARRSISVVAHQYLAKLFAQQHKIDEAQAAIREGVEQDPNDSNALNGYAWFLATSDVPELRQSTLAVELAQRAASLAPDNAMVLNTLGVAQSRAGKWEDTITSLATAEKLTPDRSTAFNGFFLAMAHWHLGQKDEARTWYDRSVEWMDENQPKNEDLIRFRGDAELLLGIVNGESTSPPSSSASAPPSDTDRTDK